jgi:hypothetical protein
MATTKSLIAIEEVLDRLSPDQWRARAQAWLAQPTGGCNACRFADPLSDRLCTVPDISAEDFDLGVSGINCSRFQPREAEEA